MTSAAEISRALKGHRSGNGWACHCPVPSHGKGHGDRSPSLSVSDGDNGPLLYCHSGCDYADIADELRVRGLFEQGSVSHVRRPALVHPSKDNPESDANRRLRVQWLASQLRPADGTIVETYLREARGYAGAIPATLGFLPATTNYPPSMIALFGMPYEVEPGILHLPLDRVAAVHLTRLMPDGRGKAAGEKAKIMIGPVKGSPIVLAPPNDLLGLVIAEGIETGLSIHQATGLGVWAAGAASFMPALANIVPDYIDTLTVVGEADPAGYKGAVELVDCLIARGIHTELRFLGEEGVMAA